MPLRQLFRGAGAVVPPKPAKPSPILRHAVGSAVPAPRRPVSAIPAQGNTDCPPKDRGNQRPRECYKRERAGSRREAPYSAVRWRKLSRASILDQLPAGGNGGSYPVGTPIGNLNQPQIMATKGLPKQFRGSAALGRGGRAAISHWRSCTATPQSGGLFEPMLPLRILRVMNPVS